MEILSQFLQGIPIKLLPLEQMLADSIKLFWNLLLLGLQCHLSIPVNSIHLIIEFSPSANRIKEKDILHKIKSVIKYNSSS